MGKREHNLAQFGPKRILVCGGSGFIGSHLVEALLDQGYIVGVVARTLGKLSLLNGEHAFGFYSRELRNFVEVEEVVQSFAPDTLVYLAAHPDGKENFDQATACLQDNLASTLNALEAFRRADGDLFIYGDSCKAYDGTQVPHTSHSVPRPLSSYAIAKTAGWQLCDLYNRVHGLATVSVRPTLVHGPRQSYNLVTYIVDCVSTGKSAVVLDGGEQTRDLLFVGDLVDAYLRIIAVGKGLAGKVIHLGGGREMKVIEIARLVLDVMGSDLPVVAAPHRVRPTEMFRSYCDNSEALAWLGWQPSMDLRRAVLQTVQALTQDRTIAIAAAQTQTLHALAAGAAGSSVTPS